MEAEVLCHPTRFFIDCVGRGRDFLSSLPLWDRGTGVHSINHVPLIDPASAIDLSINEEKYRVGPIVPRVTN
jgi:hypothetical protein